MAPVVATETPAAEQSQGEAGFAAEVEVWRGCVCLDFGDEVGAFYAAGEDYVGGAFAYVGIGGGGEGLEDFDGDRWEGC